MSVITTFLHGIDQLFSWLIGWVALPMTLLFFGTAVFFTLWTRFIQFRAAPRFITLIRQGFHDDTNANKSGARTISAFQALATAMASTIGMGNIVGPSVAIMIGGPGALFWLIVYIFFGSATKFAEVTFALRTRVKTKGGYVVGGPMQYLKEVSDFLAHWYGTIMLFLFMAWSSLQANTLAEVFEQEGMPRWVVGLALATIVCIILRGGVHRVGAITSKLVPIMFVMYVFFACLILFSNTHALAHALREVFSYAFSFAAPVGGFAGATLYNAMHSGIYRGSFITEAGLGTSSIPHAVANTKNPTDQGILALYSMTSDAILSMLSGLLVLITGVWMQGELRNTLIYDVFRASSPTLGRYILVLTIALFVLTTVIGNSFNGVQSFRSQVGQRWICWYKLCTVSAIFFGAFMPVEHVWRLMDVLLTLIAIPNLIGLLVLAFRYPNALEPKK